MKTMITAILALAVCLPLAAAETTKQEKPMKRSTPKETMARQDTPASTTISTGSLLPSKVRQSGQITDGARNVQVFDSDSIRQSGASDLASFLKRRGATR